MVGQQTFSQLFYKLYRPSVDHVSCILEEFHKLFSLLGINRNLCFCLSHMQDGSATLHYIHFFISSYSVSIGEVKMRLQQPELEKSSGCAGFSFLMKSL